MHGFTDVVGSLASGATLPIFVRRALVHARKIRTHIKLYKIGLLIRLGWLFPARQ